MAICHSELHLSRSEVMDYPSLDFAGMMNEFRKMREQQNKPPKPTGVDGVNTGDISEEDMDTSEWFKQ